MKRTEILSIPLDRKVDGIPRHASTRRMGVPKRAAVFGTPETFRSGPTVFGSYPKAFLPWAARMLETRQSEILHLCSGGLTSKDGGLRVDVRIGQQPDVVADARKLPFPDGVFRAVLIDPPYTVEYAESLYQTDYPRPQHLLKEALRVTAPGGRIGIVHFLVPHSPKGCRIVAVRGIVTGCGYRIRALTVYQREQEKLKFEIDNSDDAVPYFTAGVGLEIDG